MNYFVQLHHLRKSVWAIIDEGVANGADLYNGEYAGLYTPDVNLQAVIRTATDVDSHKLLIS
jgi:hypothetical protein